MKQKTDKLKKYLIVNKKTFFFLTVLFIIGIIAGSIFSVTLNDNDVSLVDTYLEDYIKSIDSNTLIFKDLFLSNFSSELLTTVIIWILGISVIGIPVIIFLFFYKTFVLGFAISTILLKYKVKGLLLSIVYVFPHFIINILILMVVISYALNISLKLINAVIKRKEVSFKDITYKYLIILLVSIIILVLTSLYISFVVPKLIKLLIPLLV